jgi:hypothetical protein
MIEQSQDGGALLQDAALAWNDALSEYRITPNRQTASILMNAAGQWALDVGPITPGMQTELDASAYLRTDPSASSGVPAASSGAIWLLLAVVGAIALTGNTPKGRRR